MIVITITSAVKPAVVLVLVILVLQQYYNNNTRNSNSNHNARSSRKRAQARGRFHRYFRCFRHFRCRMYRCCRRSWRRQMRAHRQSADMHFTWPAWDKTQFRAGLFRKCVCVASAWVCCGNPVRETKNAFFCVKTLNANCRKACSHAFYVACVGQHPGSFSSVCELCLRSVCLTPI